MIIQIPERVRQGGMTGGGFLNLLGRPPLDLLSLLLRESVQNAWDARRRSAPRPPNVHFRIRLRNLEGAQARTFRSAFAQDDVLEPPGSNSLRALLNQPDPIRVLELHDSGTVGLAGAMRPDEPHGEEVSRFVNFFFDYGRARAEQGDGGTYGFGRSSLYLASKASMILVDTLVHDGHGFQRRLMACRIGSDFEVARGSHRGRYTGRHFWGRKMPHLDVAQPLTGHYAEKLAERLGLPARRNQAELGTSVMIPWPEDGLDDGERIVRVLLHNLWPKMVLSDRQPVIRFEVEVDGRKFEIPDPASVGEYRLAVRALKSARTHQILHGAFDIRTLRPAALTGWLAVEQAPQSRRAQVHAVASGDSDEPAEPALTAVGSVALMRPTELVVRYLPIPGAERVAHDWSGVFICSDDARIHTAFARSEPPAHDDWVANRLTDKHDKYFVRKTVQSLIPEKVRELLKLDEPVPGMDGASGMSLAGQAEQFGTEFLVGDGTGPGVGPAGAGGGRGTSSSGPKGPRLTRISPSGLELHGDMRAVRFRGQLRGAAGDIVVVTARPSIVADARLEEPPEGIPCPLILEWVGGRGEGDRCTITLRSDSEEFEVLVGVQDDYAIRLDCTAEESTS